jgi:hypothetical protein
MYDQTILMESEVCICVSRFCLHVQGSGQNTEAPENIQVAFVSVNEIHVSVP